MPKEFYEEENGQVVIHGHLLMIIGFSWHIAYRWLRSSYAR